MATSIEENAAIILSILASRSHDATGRIEISGDELQESTELSPAEINDAVTILQESGYVEWLRFLGTTPFVFGRVILTPRGRFEYQRMSQKKTIPKAADAQILRPPIPVGSPYGFNDDDWKVLVDRNEGNEAAAQREVIRTLEKSVAAYKEVAVRRIENLSEERATVQWYEQEVVRLKTIIQHLTSPDPVIQLEAYRALAQSLMCPTVED